MLTDEQIQRILCKAARERLLILTVSDGLAVDIKTDIVDYIKNHGLASAMSDAKTRGYIYFVGGFEHIGIMSADWWSKHSPFDFKGAVYITNKQITNIPHIIREPRPFTELIEKVGLYE